MPDYPVKADVDTMLRANDKAGIRSAIGVGTTDAPTFLAQTLTGQSLTGTQATSLVDLSATWNTTGTPSALKLNVTDTASNAASKLMDLQVGGASKMSVSKDGSLSLTQLTTSISDGGNGFLFKGAGVASTYIGQNGSGAGALSVGAFASIGFSSSGTPAGAGDTTIFRDAPGILAQRNGTSAQAFRVYNSTDATPATNFDRASFGFTSSVLRIGTENGGTYTTGRSIDLITGGTPRMTIGNNGVVSIGTLAITTIASNLTFNADNAYDIGASGANRPRSLYTSSIIDSGGKIICRSGSGIEIIVNGSTSCRLLATGDGVGLIANGFSNTFDRLQLGGTTDAFPAIARDGAGIKITGAAAGSTSWIKVPAVAVASLPLAATAGVGARSFVNDALTPVFGSAVTGGGAVTVPVYSTGSAWNVG